MSDAAARTETAAAEFPIHPTIGFVGEAGAGRTTVAALVADRLRTEADVRVSGGAAGLVGARGGVPSDGVADAWTIHDLPAGSAAFANRAEELDAAFVVSTADDLDAVSEYERIADRTDTDLFLVANRRRPSNRERFRSFDGPPNADSIPDSDAVAAAVAAGDVPELDDRTVGAIPIHALDGEWTSLERGLEALARGAAVVNVEVVNEADAKETLHAVRDEGYVAAYYRCNCNGHAGHVMARTRQ